MEVTFLNFHVGLEYDLPPYIVVVSLAKGLQPRRHIATQEEKTPCLASFLKGLNVRDGRDANEFLG